MAEKKILFVGTADTDGRVNLSPKCMGSLKIIKANQFYEIHRGLESYLVEENPHRYEQTAFLGLLSID